MLYMNQREFFRIVLILATVTWVFLLYFSQNGGLKHNNLKSIQQNKVSIFRNICNESRQETNLQPRKYELNVDRELTNLSLFIEKQSTNLPFQFWLSHREKIDSKSGGCRNMPMVQDIEWSGNWQKLIWNRSNVYLYQAYYDNRVNPETIRIIAMFEHVSYFNSIFFYATGFQEAHIRIFLFLE